MAISRTREYAADRRGAEISGKPLALANALRRIASGVEQIENQTAEANPATAHMFIINPLSGAGMDNLFSTHPDTNNRIAALEEFAGTSGYSNPPSEPTESGPWSKAGSNRHAPEKATGPWG